jgi:thioredoxin reductase (NADPH)
VDDETLVPDHNPKTNETNVSGFYIAGTLTMGREANKVFIENGRVHGEKIMTDIENKLK